MSRDGGRKVGGGAALGLLALASLLAARTADDTGPAPPPTGPAPAGQEARSDWPAYGGDPGGRRYSPLDQLDRANVGRLAPAWTFRTGELGQGARDGEDLTFEATPIHFEGTLYIPTAFGVVFALDPVTGEERWRFDTGVPRGPSYSEVTSRGVSAWRDAAAEAGSPCAARVFVATIDARLIALDA
ncbi:MAG: membrane-bound PQQ-dependent dehydrogenase, glucose/quinate/shikimate family, partial [Gemmatimonadota bacterium]